MSDCPNGSSKHEFYIVAFPLSSSGRLQLSLGILIIYLITMLANLTIIFLVCFVPKLHTPMYFFLCNLAVVDVTSTSTTVPKLLSITLTQDHKICYSCCMTQLFFFIIYAAGECFVLTSMAYDRYVAICKPLQYYTIMRKSVYIAMAASGWLVDILHSLSYTLLTSVLHFCDSHEFNHFFCDMNLLLALSTSDTRSQKIFLLIEMYAIFFVQFILTIISYVFIFSTILKIRSSEGRMKAFSSCTSHLITVILFYAPGLFLYMKPDSVDSKEQNMLLSMLFLVVAPMLNPLVYSLRNKEVWRAIAMLTNQMMLRF